MGIQQRGNSWRTRYYGPDGRQRSKSFRRKSDAERWLSQQRSFIAQGDWTDPARGRITFGEYALAWQAGQQVSRVTRWVGRQFVDAENSPSVVSPLQHIEAPVGLRKRIRIPQSGVECHQHLAVHGVNELPADPPNDS